MGRLERGWAIAIVVGFATVTAPMAADASCLGPALAVGTPTDGVQPVLVAGYYLGDDCKDTGNVPADEVLGAPLSGLELSLEQGGFSDVVARGSATSDYSFQTPVPVPQDIEAGEVKVVLRDRSGEVLQEQDVILKYGGAPGDEVEVVSFGPETDVDTAGNSVEAADNGDHGEGTRDESSEGGLSGWPLGVSILVLVAAFAGAGGYVLGRRTLGAGVGTD